MKRTLVLLSVFLALLPDAVLASECATKEASSIPVCGILVAKAYESDIKKDTSKPDKFRHCLASCVMTLHCGPVESMEVGILKEIYDALGFGTPDWKDIEADKAGIRVAIKLLKDGNAGFNSCNQACSRLFP